MDMYNELGLIYSEALTEVIAKVAGVRLQVVSQEDDDKFEEITGVMCLNGKKSGVLFISANETDMRVLCSYFTGLSLAEVTTGDTEDTICEFANMTAGNAKLNLSGTDFIFNLAPPFALKGKNMSLISKSKTHVISRTLSDGVVSVKLKLLY